MYPFIKKRIFRTFSANHWNQPELSIHFLALSDSELKTMSIFSSNAEKLRKLESQGIEKNQLALARTIRSNGFTILFPIFPKYSKI